MVHFYYHKLLSVELPEPELHSTHRLIIRYEYTHSYQQDGHSPAHGDMNRDFAENVIGNLPRQEIASALKERNIKGISDVCYYGIKVVKTDRFEEYMPVYEMEIRMMFAPEEDTQLSIANQLLNSITWQDAKKAMFS